MFDNTLGPRGSGAGIAPVDYKANEANEANEARHTSAILEGGRDHNGDGVCKRPVSKLARVFLAIIQNSLSLRRRRVGIAGRSLGDAICTSGNRN